MENYIKNIDMIILDSSRTDNAYLLLIDKYIQDKTISKKIRLCLLEIKQHINLDEEGL